MNHPPESTPCEPASALAITRANQMSNALRFIHGSIHEINNDLGPLVGYLSIMEIGVEIEPKFICAMQDSVQRLQVHLARMSAQLKAPAASVPESGPLLDLVQRALDPLQAGGFFRRTSMELVVDPHLARHGEPCIRVCPVRLSQALTNLLSNAVDAMDARDKRLDGPKSIQVHLRANPTQVQVEVQDFGKGMSPIEQTRAFETFYSTKVDQGQGLGLGLGVTRSLIEQMGGRLELATAPQQGTRALMTLPRSS